MSKATTWAEIKKGYAAMSADDKAMFWVHFAVAPALMVGSLLAVFGWPVLVFILGVLMWMGSDD